MIWYKNIFQKHVDEYFKENDIVGEYTILKLIGEGRFGIVYLAVGEDKKKYVIKQLRKEMLEKTGDKKLIEESILKGLQYPYFPKFISRFNDETKEGYILEYMEGKVFEDLIWEEGYRFSKTEIYEVCSKLLDLVEILHSNNIVHRDIRLPNVIRNDNQELFLIDFGLARIIDHNRYDKDLDYWYIADFLIHLYYSTYKKSSLFEKPWFKELDLNSEEKIFLRKLMGIEKPYHDIYEIRAQLLRIRNIEELV